MRQLIVVNDDEVVAVVRRYLVGMTDEQIRVHVRLIRQICHQNHVALVRATPEDYQIIRNRVAIGWEDDRP